jgi:hypothetical protein
LLLAASVTKANIINFLKKPKEAQAVDGSTYLIDVSYHSFCNMADFCPFSGN